MRKIYIAPEIEAILVDEPLCQLRNGSVGRTTTNTSSGTQTFEVDETFPIHQTGNPDNPNATTEENNAWYDNSGNWGGD